MREELEPLLPFTKLYARTGIQYQSFNTVYQLCALKKERPDQLAAAEHFLMVPDYLNYRLTGVMANEYTNASTTALVGAISKDWTMKSSTGLVCRAKSLAESAPPAPNWEI